MQSSDQLKASETRAAELLERLLTDDEFRASFRRDPASACEQFDLPELATEFGGGAGGPMFHTLEIRESRSSLAGAFMAAASEGTGAVDHLKNLHDNHLHGEAHRVVHHALTSPKLQAIDPDHLHGAGLTDNLAGSGSSEHLASSTEITTLLHNPHLTFSPEAHAALARGGADARLVSVLDDLTKEHQLRIGTLQVSHGSGGDSFDILSVDGERVSQSNIYARDLANELASLDPSLRPAEVVTPWPIEADGFTQGGGHDDRIQIVFDAPSTSSAPATHMVAGTDNSVDTSTSPARAEHDATGLEHHAAGRAHDAATGSHDHPLGGRRPATGAQHHPAGLADDAAARSHDHPLGRRRAATGAQHHPAGRADDAASRAHDHPLGRSAPPPEPTTTPPPAPTTPPPAPVQPPEPQGSSTSPADTTTPPAGGSSPSGGTPPDPTTTPPAGAPTPPPEPSTTPPAAPTTPPATPPAGGGTPPATSGTPPADATTTPPPEPVTPVATPGAPPPPPTHQSVVIGAVQGLEGNSTFLCDVPAAGHGGAAAESALQGLDPNAAGGLPDASDTYPGANAAPAGDRGLDGATGAQGGLACRAADHGGA